MIGIIKVLVEMINIRSLKSLDYIKSYFKEYLIWLKNIKKYDLI